MAEASIVRLLCHIVPEIYFLADETKLMKKDFIYICQLGKGRNLITNSSISEKCIHTYEQLGACVITESQKDRITIPVISGLFISCNYLLFASVVVFFAAVVVVVVAAVDAVVALYLNLTSFHRS